MTPDTASEHKRLIAYSLLAALGEESGEDGLDNIFIPLVKKGIIEINNKYQSKGASILEIRDKLKDIFGLDFPIPYLQKLLLEISIQFKREFGAEITLHKDLSFQFQQQLSLKLNNTLIKNFENKIIDEDNRVTLIENLFNKFLELNGVSANEEITLIEFIELNKIALSNYFSNNQNEAGKIRNLKFKEKELNVVAKFFLEVKKDAQLYNILKKLYLGSVYSAYLSLEPEASNLKLELVLDTSFLLGLLNLQSIEKNDTCRKIYEMSCKLGFTLTVLKITIEETQDLLDVKVESFNREVLERQLNPESILGACDRNNISKDELTRISAKLETTLTKDFKINVLNNDDRYRELAKTKYLYLFKLFRSRKPTDFNALHDTVAEAYVIESRGRTVYSFLSSKVWFVKGSTLNVYNPKHKNGLPPFISAPVLVNILWLTSPATRINLTRDDVSQIGITKLISSTLDSSLPPQSLLRSFDNNLTRLADKKIDVSDCVIVATKMAEKELIKDLNKTIENNLLSPEVITKKVNDYKKEFEKKDEVWRNEVRTFLEETTSNLKLEKTELQIERERVENQNIKLQEEQNQLIQKQNQLRQHILISKVNIEFKKWQLLAYLSFLGALLSIAVIILTFTFIEADWNIMSKFYEWAETNDSIRKEFMIKGIIELFFFGFSTFCIHTTIIRWFSKKAKRRKLQELTDEYKDQVNSIGEQVNMRMR